jgi:hypothetical protein
VPREVILCGGGASNPTLKTMLAQRLPQSKLMTTDDFGISSDAKEAISFAILPGPPSKALPIMSPPPPEPQDPPFSERSSPADFQKCEENSDSASASFVWTLKPDAVYHINLVEIKLGWL